jgi:hypothetical protein
MRVKVGDQWFECKPGQPIMVDLAAGDRRNIANMPSNATRYAIFDDADSWPAGDKLAWMDAVARSA